MEFFDISFCLFVVFIGCEHLNRKIGRLITIISTNNGKINR
jgi:hypothetical protein